MRLVVFGLSVTSARDNAHATFWRGVLRALAADGHEVVFFERDTPFFAGHRDLVAPDGYEVVVYPSWSGVLPRARRAVSRADVAIVTSGQADAAAATELVVAAGHTRIFYDLDAPVTFQRLDRGELVSWLPPGGFGELDLVLSVTGGAALERFRRELGARRVAPLFACVDADAFRPPSPRREPVYDLSYLATSALDGLSGVESLLFGVAERAPERRLLVGGVAYAEDRQPSPNLDVVPRVPPAERPAFYGRSRLTLDGTAAATASSGFCPSPRLFEAAACGVPIISDGWHGIESFFAPGDEILVAAGADDVLAMLELSPEALGALARGARERVLAEHTAVHRARELVELARAIPARRASAA
ncbi:MAG: glycosyltransferase [Labilithrix sp.]|nr:glycosyltransferase [Labilithrix sp.]